MSPKLSPPPFLQSQNDKAELADLRPTLVVQILIPMLFGGFVVCLLIVTAIHVGWRVVEWNFAGLLLISTISSLLSVFAYVRGRKTILYNDRIYDQRWHIITNTCMLRDICGVSSRRNFSNLVFSRIEIVHSVSGKRVREVLNAGLYKDEEVDRFCECANSIIQRAKQEEESEELGSDTILIR